jgi:hypothetical protein
MNEIDRQSLRCPWRSKFSNAAYAAESVIKLIKDEEGETDFSSHLVKRLFHYRSGMTFHDPKSETHVEDNNAHLIGSILHKIAQRGLPAPCSLKIERYILNQARDAGILDFKENEEGNRIQFVISELKIPNLSWMVEACCFPELLLGDDEVDHLLDEYKKLCTSPERAFFEELEKMLEIKFHDKRLALFIIPQRQMDSMVDFSVENSSLVDASDIVDFAVEIPKLTKNDSWLKIAIEIDDRIHINYKDKDKERDRVLKNANWTVRRYDASRKNWKFIEAEIIDEIAMAIPSNLLLAAKDLRSLPAEKKWAIQSLVIYPVAESQIMTALAMSLAV